MKKFFDCRRELVSVGPGSGGGGGSGGVGGNFIGRTFVIGHHQVTVEETLAEGQDDHMGSGGVTPESQENMSKFMIRQGRFRLDT